MDSVALNFSFFLHFFEWTHEYILFGHLQRGGIAVSEVMYIFNFNKYYQNIFQDSCNNVYFCQQCLTVLAVLIVMPLCNLQPSLVCMLDPVTCF